MERFTKYGNIIEISHPLVTLCAELSVAYTLSVCLLSPTEGLHCSPHEVSSLVSCHLCLPLFASF